MSVLDRIPRVLQLAAALVTLTGGAVAILNFTVFGDGPEGSVPPTTEEPVGEFPGTRDTILNEAPDVPPVAIITDVRISEHEGFDRVTFEFRDNAPGYRVEYVTEPMREPAAQPIEIQGEAYLQVRLMGAQAHAGGDSTLEERRYDPDLPSVAEVVVTGDVGGQVTAVIGLTRPLDYRVDRAVDPFRTIVEIAHP